MFLSAVWILILMVCESSVICNSDVNIINLNHAYVLKVTSYLKGVQ